MEPQAFKEALCMGDYGDGGYPLYFLTSDGSTFHPSCVKKRAKDALRYLHGKERWSEWKIEAHGVNWEDPELTCDECGKRIESAYAEDFVGRKAILDGDVCCIALESTDGGLFRALGSDRYDRIERVYRRVKAPLVTPYARGVKAQAKQLRIRAWWVSDEKGTPLPKREPIKLVIDRVTPWGRVFRSRPWEYGAGWNELATKYRLLIND